jgi:hypothetical protein
MAKKSTLFKTLKALKSSIKSANKLIPSFVVILGALSFWIIYLIVNYTPNLITGITALIVFIVSIVVYITSSNYGEAALSLVAGILTVFSVEWGTEEFIIFITVWLGFTFFAILIYSIKLAAEVEDIYRQASISLAGETNNQENIEKRLHDIGKNSEVEVLDPVERAKIIRIFCFRKVDLRFISQALRSVEKLSVITKVDFKNVALFVADIYKVLEYESEKKYQNVLDWIYTLIRDTPVPPIEFIESFENTRRIILSENVDFQKYLKILKDGLESGVDVNEMHEYIETAINN